MTLDLMAASISRICNRTSILVVDDGPQDPDDTVELPIIGPDGVPVGSQTDRPTIRFPFARTSFKRTLRLGALAPLFALLLSSTCMRLSSCQHIPDLAVQDVLSDCG